jgi:hypothetical protein
VTVFTATAPSGVRSACLLRRCIVAFDACFGRPRATLDHAHAESARQRAPRTEPVVVQTRSTGKGTDVPRAAIRRKLATNATSTPSSVSHDLCGYRPHRNPAPTCKKCRPACQGCGRSGHRICRCPQGWREMRNDLRKNVFPPLFGILYAGSVLERRRDPASRYTRIGLTQTTKGGEWHDQSDALCAPVGYPAARV